MPAIRTVDARSFVRWGLREALPKMSIALGARSGDPYARLRADRSLIEDPYPFYAALRDAAPVVPGKLGALTARHDVCSEIVRSPEFLVGFPVETYPRAMRALIAWAEDPAVLSVVDRPSMLVSNGAEHGRFRRLVTSAFTPRAVAALGARTEEIATELLDDLARTHAGGGVADLVAEYAALLPAYVICEVLGVPVAMRDDFLAWTRPMVALTDRGSGYRAFRVAEAGVRTLNAWFLRHLAELRRNPGDDLLSDIITRADRAAADGGPAFSETDLMVTASLLLAAASETTVSLIGNAVVALLDHPDQLAALRADPTGWPNAIDEVLRYDSPSQITYRYPLRDTVVHGVPIRRGRFLMPVFAGANRDPSVFPDADVFDITRPNAGQHLSFSAGAHYCFGSALARLESEVALRRFFERFPAVELAERPRRRPSLAMRGYAAIPARLGGAG